MRKRIRKWRVFLNIVGDWPREATRLFIEIRNKYSLEFGEKRKPTRSFASLYRKLCIQNASKQ